MCVAWHGTAWHCTVAPHRLDPSPQQLVAVENARPVERHVWSPERPRPAGHQESIGREGYARQRRLDMPVHAFVVAVDEGDMVMLMLCTRHAGQAGRAGREAKRHFEIRRRATTGKTRVHQHPTYTKIRRKRTVVGTTRQERAQRLGRLSCRQTKPDRARCMRALSARRRDTTRHLPPLHLPTCTRLLLFRCGAVPSKLGTYQRVTLLLPRSGEKGCRRVRIPAAVPSSIAFSSQYDTDLVFASVFSLVRSTITRWGSPSAPGKNLAVPLTSSIPSRCSWSRTTSVSLISTCPQPPTKKKIVYSIVKSC